MQHRKMPFFGILFMRCCSISSSTVRRATSAPQRHSTCGSEADSSAPSRSPEKERARIPGLMEPE